MSVKIMALVWDLDLPAKEKMLLLALADNANDYGSSCYPSVATLSRKTSMPERTVQRMIASLISKKCLSTHYEQAHDRSRKLVRHFRFHLSGIPQAPIPDYRNCPKPLREETIAAFGMTCAYCGEAGDHINGPDGKAWHIDRIIAGSRGGKYIPENVTLSCGPCNQSKGANVAPQETASLGAILDNEGCQNGHDRGATHGTQTIIEPSEEPSEDTSRRSGARVPSRHIDLIFTHWQTEHGHAKAKCSEKRRRLIAKRLKDYGLEELRQCITGYKLSPFHRGDNAAGQRYDSLELMLRDAEHVERGIEFFANPPKDKPNAADKSPSRSRFRDSTDSLREWAKSGGT